jgi:hypothetical protein
VSEEQQTKRGRFSAAELEEVKSLHEKGRKPEFIAKKLNRGVENIKKILGLAEEKPEAEKKKAGRPPGSKNTSTKNAESKPKEETAAEEPEKKPGRPAGSGKASGSAAGETVAHDFWIRRNMMVRINLPANLTKAEAESLAAKVANCAFN